MISSETKREHENLWLTFYFQELMAFKFQFTEKNENKSFHLLLLQFSCTPLAPFVVENVFLNMERFSYNLR